MLDLPHCVQDAIGKVKKLKVIHDYCEANNLKVDKYFFDNGVSGLELNRKDLNALLELGEKGNKDLIKALEKGIVPPTINYKEKDEDNKETGKYLAGVRITVDEKNNEKFHIDMQSWVVTADEEYIPFIGVYNYTGPSKRFTNSGKEIDERVNPQYIVVKVVYRDETNKTEYASYIKQDISLVKGTFSTNQEVGVNGDAGNQVDSNRELFLAITIATVLSLALAVACISYSYTKKNLKK